MKFIIGIDEAGRGPLAGPVSIGVCMVEEKFTERISEIFPKLKDSKKLTEKKREEFFVKMEELKKSGELNFEVELVSENIIDEKGISYAIKLGISNCLRRLNIDPTEAEVLLDGGLKAPEHFQNQKTIIKGDELESTISLASIVAKVTRDRFVVALALKYPEYGLDIHKGYGTLSHRNAIKQFGLSPVHRVSFCRNID